VNARPHARDSTLTTLLLPHSAALYCRCLCPAALRAETLHWQYCSSWQKFCPSRSRTSSCIPSRCSPVCTRYPLRRALTLRWSKRQVSRTQCHMQAQTLLVLQCCYGSHGGQPEAGLLRTPSAERLRDAGTTWWRRDPRRGVERQSPVRVLHAAQCLCSRFGPCGEPMPVVGRAARGSAAAVPTVVSHARSDHQRSAARH
jgi:hypothetical protein